MLSGYKYYVDPGSKSNVELGTFSHPFKALDDPIRELFNFGIPILGLMQTPPLISILVKHGSNTTIHSDTMPLIIASSDVLIR